MLDRTIPFYNTILRCDNYRRKDVVLPEGFSIVPYKCGYEKAWAALEYSIGDFASMEEAENYFTATYLQKPELFGRIFFLTNKDDEVVGSCIAWQDERRDGNILSLTDEATNSCIAWKDERKDGNILSLTDEATSSCIAWKDERRGSMVSSLHWLIVTEKYQGLGLGKALCCAVMNIFEEEGTFPVYIHTQPWSFKAIFLYLSLGFKLQKNDTFSHYENEYYKAMAALKKVVTKEQFELLQQLSEE
ncbi:MAG: GNAT family N-acetyltransferase [Lachnospiraceae bacterium]|nr:GNAT family N-acetyltransferase [Lachnospiraceae bacterium]